MVYFGTLELMSDEFDIYNPGVNRIQIKKLTQNLQLSRQKTLKILRFCDEKAKENKEKDVSFFVTIEKDHVVVKSNRLARLCDNHTQKLLKDALKLLQSENEVTSFQEVEEEVRSKKEHIDYPSWLDPSLWKEFKKYRTKIKAPLTDHAEKLCLADLKKMINEGHTQKDIVNQTIMSGKWKSFFPVRNKTKEIPLVKQPECSKCFQVASNIKRGQKCPFCAEIA